MNRAFMVCLTAADSMFEDVAKGRQASLTVLSAGDGPGICGLGEGCVGVPLGAN